MSETQRDGSEMRCKRCGANECRIHGFCSVECEHYFDYEEEITDLEARIAELEAQLAEEVKYEINEKVRKGKSICEACGGDGSLLLTDGYKGQAVATVECIYCNGTGYVDESPNDTQTDTVVYGKDSD